MIWRGQGGDGDCPAHPRRFPSCSCWGSPVSATGHKAGLERSAPEHLLGVGLEAGEAGSGHLHPPPVSAEVSKEDLRHLGLWSSAMPTPNGHPFSANPEERCFLQVSFGIPELGEPFGFSAKPSMLQMKKLRPGRGAELTQSPSPTLVLGLLLGPFVLSPGLCLARLKK